MDYNLQSNEMVGGWDESGPLKCWRRKTQVRVSSLVWQAAIYRFIYVAWFFLPPRRKKGDNREEGERERPARLNGLP